MKQIIVAIIGLSAMGLFFFSTTKVVAQKKKLAIGASQERVGFVFRNERQRNFKIRFRQCNNLIVIPLKINNSDTLNFVLDTGVGHTLITDASLITKLQLPLYREIKITGSNGQEDLKAYISNASHIQLGKIQAQKQGVLVLKEDVLGLSAHAGMPIHGLIGYDLFSRFIVQINYLAQEILFQSTTTLKQDKLLRKRFRPLPIELKALKPHLKAQITLENSHCLETELLIDTGAGHSLALERDNNPLISLPQKRMYLPLGMSLTGRIDGEVGRIKQLEMQNFVFKQVITFFPDSLQTAMMRQKTQTERDGSLGCALLNRFHIIFDYTRKTIWLKPNVNYKVPFEYNTSGIDLKAEKPDYKQYTIAYIYPHSAAAEAGLKVGDTLIAVDNKLTYNLKMEQVHHLLNKKAGRKVMIIVQRQQLLLTFELKLKAPI